MKKRYLSLIFAFVLLVPCILLLSACGGKKVTSINYENLFVSDKYYYEYGTNINEIISTTNLIVTATYDDNSTKVLEPNEYTIEYSKGSEAIDQIAEIPDVGYYSVHIKHGTVSAGPSFEIIPTYNNSPYEVNLTKKTWTYGEELPEVSLTSYIPEDGETVDFYYVKKSAYDNMSEYDKCNVETNASNWTNAELNMTAGEYYVFAKINFVNTSNYKGTKIDANCLVTVKEPTA